MPKNLSEDPVFIVPEKDADLIDKLGALNTQIKILEREANFLKEAAKARFQPGDYSGTLYKAAVAIRSRVALSKELVLQDMGEEWVQQHSAETTFTEIRFAPIGS